MNIELSLKSADRPAAFRKTQASPVVGDNTNNGEERKE
jgi:hypothetical protein